MRVLFVVPYPIEGPSSRLRVWQYLVHLEKLGVTCCFRPFMSSSFYKVVYQQGHFLTKACYFVVGFVKRILDLIRSKKYDLVFVQREAIPIGPPFFEYIVTKILRKPLIYDFDDAIFLKPKSRYNRPIQFLKSPQKVSKIIQMSRHVIAGNEYLLKYALKFNKKASLIITPVDTERFQLGNKKDNKDNVTLGWIGSHSTSKFLLPFKETFRILKSKYPSLIIRFIGAENFPTQMPSAQFWMWKLEREVEDLSTFDIGIMPLPHDEWSKGKCGYKLLQYMAVRIPAVCSPVGINKQLVKDGENGYFASTEKEWLRKLSNLIEDPDKRRKMGTKGRKLAENQYSLKIWLPRFHQVLEETFRSAYGE